MHPGVFQLKTVVFLPFFSKKARKAYRSGAGLALRHTLRALIRCPAAVGHGGKAPLPRRRLLRCGACAFVQVQARLPLSKSSKILREVNSSNAPSSEYASNKEVSVPSISPNLSVILSAETPETTTLFAPSV